MTIKAMLAAMLTLAESLRVQAATLSAQADAVEQQVRDLRTNGLQLTELGGPVEAPKTATQRIEEILAETGGPINYLEVHKRLNQEGPPVALGTVSARMNQMVSKGIASRVSKGVYEWAGGTRRSALRVGARDTEPQATPSDRVRPRRTRRFNGLIKPKLGERMEDWAERALKAIGTPEGQPIGAIARWIAEHGYQGNHSNLHTSLGPCLSIMTSEGKAVRVGKGMYTHP